MTPPTSLHEAITAQKEAVRQFSPEKLLIPDYITANLKHRLFQWQSEALENFLTYKVMREKKGNPTPTHLMFNMATGSGKTLMMAALILYYYRQGYRCFLFFVSHNNVIDKTENNFIQKSHNKYLFHQNLVIEDRIVNIRKVETFDSGDDIQIKFTTIHKLHNSIHAPRENAVTLDELRSRKLVMIGDEAHHLNAATMDQNAPALPGLSEPGFSQELADNASEDKVERSWEDTVVNRILGKEGDNVLLEFTATIPQKPEVIEKYRDKTIARFELADFLRAGYTKEINLVSTSLEKKEKILLALLFQWYRHRIALKHGIPDFKPVILFRSKLIADSQNDFEEFKSLIAGLRGEDFAFLREVESKIKEEENLLSVLSLPYQQSRSRIRSLLGFIRTEKVKPGEIAAFLKYEFAERNCIITNSATKENTTEEEERLLNSLEDRRNRIRAIFTVKRLTEGWDVLNLFDIVRLYQGRDEDYQKGKRKAGTSTVQEVQLIGRGVRYYPFTWGEVERNRRKFDHDLENEVRVLEEFYFHSEDNIGYLDELKRELRNQGYIASNRVVKRFALKDSFLKTNFYKNTKVWKNHREDNPDRRRPALESITTVFRVHDLTLREEHIRLDEKKDETLAESQDDKPHTMSIPLKVFRKHFRHVLAKAIHRKAVPDLSLFRHDHFTREVDAENVEEFLCRDGADGKPHVLEITAAVKDKAIRSGTMEENQVAFLQQLDSKIILKGLLQFLDEFSKKLREEIHPYRGTKFVSYRFEEIFGSEKEKSVIVDRDSQQLEEELMKPECRWYILNGFNGTGEERGVIEFVRDRLGNLEEKYAEVYLLRNEEVYRIYDFEQGRGFAPDYLLFMKGKKKQADEFYQVFIEAKGEQFTDAQGQFMDGREGWKEEFLLEITKRYETGEVLRIAGEKYLLVGLKFYNEQNKKVFGEDFDEKFLHN